MKVVWNRVSLGGEYAPEPRWGHTSAAHGTNMVIFGGTGSSKLFNDCHFYDTVRNKWSTKDSRGSVPNARFAHSSTPLPDGRIVVFGGKGAKHYSDIYMFEPDRCNWTKTGKASSDARAGHTAVLSPDSSRIYFYGGTGSHSKYFDNICVLDLATMTMSKPSTSGDGPLKLSGHCAFLVRNQMLVFGGYDGKKYYNDIYALDLDTMVWGKIEASGTPPKARSGHTSTLVAGNTHLLVYGGCATDSSFLSDVHLLRLADMTWLQPAIQGSEPHARFRHTATMIGNVVYFFAGTAGGALFSDILRLEFDVSIPSLITPPSPSLQHTTTSSSSRTISSNSLPITTTTTTTTSSHTSSHVRTSSFDTTSPVTSSPSHPHPLPPRPASPVHSASPDMSKLQNMDPVELGKMYVSAILALKSERQQRMDIEREINQVKPSFTEKIALAVKPEKEGKGKQKTVTIQQYEALQQENANLRKKMDELQSKLASETAANQDLRQNFEQAEQKSLQGVKSLTEQLKEMSLRNAHIMGQDLDALPLQDLIELEAQHALATGNIMAVRKKKQELEAKTQLEEIERLRQIKANLEEAKTELMQKLNSAAEDLTRKDLELSNHVAENAQLRAKTSLLDGNEIETMPLEQLLELENMHHEGLKRVSQMRQTHMQRAIEKLKKEKEALQEKQLCIICTEKPSNCVLMPCRHTSMCSTCCALITRCPICRSEITKRIHTF